jgi:hypothetical protein
MKLLSILFFLFIVLNVKSVSAQKFTLNELFQYQKMDLGEINDSLLARKWKFFKSEGQTESKYGESIWYFGKFEKYKVKAEGWFYFLAADSLPNRIIYQFQKTEQFDALKIELDKSTFREIGSEMYEGSIIVFYRNNDFVVGTTIFPEDNVSAYALTIYTVEDYLKLKGIKEEAIKKKNK